MLGGSLAVLGVLLLPHAFDALSELFSLSQSRRLAAFLPLPFALAGAAMILGRLRIFGALFALGVGESCSSSTRASSLIESSSAAPPGRRGSRFSAAWLRSSPG